MIESYAREINVQECSGILFKMGNETCYLRSESVSMKFFLLNMYEAANFISAGQAYTSFNLLRISNFFCEIY